MGQGLVASDQVIVSPETRLRYRVGTLLGRGGFGQAFLARRLGRSTQVPSALCIKVSRRIDGWLREAYFGQLLDGHPRAIRVFDAFPMPGPDGQILYCLALEHARHGDLRAYLRRAGRGFGEAAARREIAGILQVLGKLHRGQLLHRDLTPMNVFVCEGPTLKLGDFGLVRQQSDRRGAPSWPAPCPSGGRGTTSTRSGSCSACWCAATPRGASAPAMSGVFPAAIS
jgi:serine/threonine protein kinase